MATVGFYPPCFYHHVGTYKFFMVNKNILDESTLRSFQPTCQCSSIQFGTVAEVLDRNSLQIMDPPDFGYPSVEDVQVQQTVKEEMGTFEESSIQVSSQNGRGLAVKAMGEVFGNGKLAYVETNSHEPPDIENEESAVDAGTKYKETLYVSGQKISFQQGLEESLNVQESNRKGIFKRQEETKQRLNYFEENCCKLDDETKPRLKGGAKKEKIKIKYFGSKEVKFNIILNLLRSSRLIDCFNKHNRCEPSLSCSFCLLRSLMNKINNPKGRQAVVPVEIECQPFSLQQPVSSLLDQLMIRVNASYPEFKNAMSPTLYCICCSTNV